MLAILAMCTVIVVPAVAMFMSALHSRMDIDQLDPKNCADCDV